MNTDFSQFHFIRPEWLLLLPVVVALWWFIRKASAHQQWQDHFPKVMLEALQVNGYQRSNLWHWWLLVSWLLLSIAMAGPTWVKQAVPLVKNQKALVIALDLSPSMLAEDLTPNRLTRAKYKLIDILTKQADGQVALIAYAGDAHTVSPLTDDPKTIEALLPALHPNVMPSRGSNIEAAITLAQSLLTDAGVASGDVLVLTDGIASQAINDIEDQFNNTHRLSILGVGGGEAAPVKLANGGFLRDSANNIVLASVNRNELLRLANNLGGRYSDLSTSDTDINYLLNDEFESENDSNSLTSGNQFDAWKDFAHLLVLLVLPIAVLCFRKGVIYLIPIIILLPVDSQAAEKSTWKNAWRTPDQQAEALFKNEQYQTAADTFENTDWSAIAQYKNGNFADAAKQFSKNENDLSSIYNQANALAMSGQLEQAIETYEKVLQQDTDHADALHNKKIIETLLEQQKQQEQNNQQGDDQNQDKQDGEKSEQQTQNGDSSESQNDSQEQSEQQADGNEPSEDEEPSAGEKPSADEQSSANEQSSSEQEPSDDNTDEEQPSDQEQSASNEESDEASEKEQQAQAAQAEESDKDQNEEAEASKAIAADQAPLKDTSEQWLRTIQDDPSGLLRRKFKYQSDRRNQKQNNSQQDRY